MKKEVKLIILALSLIVCSVIVSADEMNFTDLTPGYNASYGSSTISFTCNVTADSAAYNIVNITITVYTGGDNNTALTYLSEGTTSDLAGANNATTVTLDLRNSFISSGLDVSYFNGFVNFTYNCKASDDQGAENVSTNMSFLNPLMGFKGTIFNSSYAAADGANVTISEFVMPQGGNPPTTNILTSMLTNASGYYAFFINYSYADGSNTNPLQIAVKTNGSDGNATEIGPTLPPLPATAVMQFFANGTLYTQPAATLRISASHVSVEDESNNDEFNYEVTDLGIGVGLWNSINVNVTSPHDIVVPRDRNYTISWMRGPTGFGIEATPPLSTTVNNISSYSSTNYVIEINKTLSFNNYILSGNITVSTPLNDVNCSNNMIMRLTPSSGDFVPPGSSVNGLEWNVTNLTDGVLGVDGPHFEYYATLMGASDGINYVIEWYCSNATAASYGAIRKIQLNASDATVHITPGVLAGEYDTSGNYMSNTINTSTKCIQFYDLTDPNNPSTTINNLNVNLEVTDSSFGTLMYVAQVSSGAALNWTFLNSSTVKVRIFSPQFPPYRTSIDLGKEYCGPDSNISLKPFNMESIGSDGAKQNFSSSSLRMRFMRNSAACNVVTPDDSCVIGDTLDPNTFNPLAAMMSGKTNLMIDLNGGNGTTLYFINVDMMSSGPPDAILSENASLDNIQTGSMDQLWQFGSFAPDIYDYVLVGIPYNDSQVNEAWTFTTKIPALYDENWNMIWNTTDNGTSFTEISGNYSDYADYPSTWFTGMGCSKTESTFASDSCYVNITENKIWLKLPHFSGVGPNIQGSTPTTPSSGGGSGTTSISSGGLYIDTSEGITLELQVGDRAVFVTKGTEHTITTTQVTQDHVTFEIQSTPIIVVVPAGETKEVDLNSDGTNDIAITVKSINIRYETAEVYIRDIETPALVPIPTGEVVQPIEQPEEPAAQEEQPTSGEKSSAIQTILGVIIILAAILLVLYLFFKKKKH
ncbi:MAG: LPXTG cell wall anchor domain-containing protein [archaeon]